MAAGGHGGYYNEFRENEVDFDVSKREISYSDREYERIENGNNNKDHATGRNRARYGGVKERDVKKRKLVNGGGYPSASRKSDSGGSSGDGGSGRHDYSVRVRDRDRELGEVSSDSGSDEAVDFGKNDKGLKIEEVSDSRSPIKKRKFSPIVWDRDDKEVDNVSKSRFSIANSDLPVHPILISCRKSPDSNPHDVQISTIENDKLETAEGSLGNTPVDIGSHDFLGSEPHVGLFLSPIQKENVVFFSPSQEENHVYVENAGKPEYGGYVPAPNIRSSRWANDADEGEVSDALDNNRIQRKLKMRPGSVPYGSRNQTFSPYVVERHRGESEETRARSSESYENGYRITCSSSDDHVKDLTRKDSMEIDEDCGSDGPGVSQSYADSKSDDESHGTPPHTLPLQRSVNMLQGCRTVDEFERLNKIDEGTYGVVYRAKDKKTGEVVALKKVKMEREREGFPLTSLREINILLSFHHPSVVDVKEVVVGSNLDSVFMAMEYMEHDLKALMETMKQPFSQSEVKCLMIQLLEGTKYLHDNWVLHRDLKTSNLLLNNRGELKICDFGLSRQYGSPLKPYTHLVVTLWYRAPELLLGAKQYSTAIDMWSLGCIMAELLSKQPLFNGKTEFDQLDKIFKTLGTPNETIWPGFSKLPGVKPNFVKHQYSLLRRKFPATSFTGSPVLSDAGFDLLNKLLTYNPEKRITAEAALNHEWFREVPLPKSKDFMPTFPAHHAQDRRTRRVMKSPDPLEEQRRMELQQAKFGTCGLFG